MVLDIGCQYCAPLTVSGKSLEGGFEFRALDLSIYGKMKRRGFILRQILWGNGLNLRVNSGEGAKPLPATFPRDLARSFGGALFMRTRLAFHGAAAATFGALAWFFAINL